MTMSWTHFRCRASRIAALVAPIVTTAVGCVSLPVPADFEAGISKQQLRERFGEPVKTRTMVKSTQYVSGPVETFWSTMALGDELEIWSYASQGGDVELYFLNGADEVSAQGFNDENAVY